MKDWRDSLDGWVLELMMREGEERLLEAAAQIEIERAFEEPRRKVDALLEKMKKIKGG